jgi:hypothetical protein
MILVSYKVMRKVNRTAMGLYKMKMGKLEKQFVNSKRRAQSNIKLIEKLIRLLMASNIKALYDCRPEIIGSIKNGQKKILSSE